ncbi:MAG TPA: hypothetical protein VH438_15495 [Gemmatimonadales bacterium]|jgi:hypothetical protein
MVALWRVTGGGIAVALALVTSVANAQSPTLTVNGVGYLQYGYQLHEDSTMTPPGHQNNFDVTRAYVNVIGKFGTLLTRVTTDIDSRKAAANQLTIRLKYAYAAWTPENSSLTYKLGLLHTSLLDWEEALWDFRMQGQMAMERGGYVSSSDFGAGIDGNFGYSKVDLQLAVVSGENYSGAPGDSRKDAMGRISFKLANSDLPGRVGGLRITAYGQYGKPTTGGQRERYLGIASYKSKKALIAAEYALTKDSISGNGAVGTIAPRAYAKGQVISAYGTYWFSPKWGVIGRVDLTDPNTDSSADKDQITRVIGGITYQLHEHLRLLADVDVTSLQGGNESNAFKTSATTGSTAYFQAQITY